MSTNAAWLLDCGGGVFTALSIGSVLHVVDDMSLTHRVPLAPAHANRVLVWQQQLLPVVDLALHLKRVTSNEPQTPSSRSFACVLGWRVAQDRTEYGALLTRALPRQITVTDESMATPQPSDATLWQHIALSFFSFHGRTVPIIDPAPVFGSQSSQSVSAHTRRQY